jgi:hypothetical protein
MGKVEVQVNHSVYVSLFTDIKPRNFQKQIKIYTGLQYLHSTKILAVVLYGCEPSSLTLREEHKFQTGVGVLKNSFQKISCPKRDKVNNLELHVGVMNNAEIFKSHLVLLVLTGWFKADGVTKHEEILWWRKLSERDHMKG